MQACLEKLLEKFKVHLSKKLEEIYGESIRA
jgi:hypothetical protein